MIRAFKSIHIQISHLLDWTEDTVAWKEDDPSFIVTEEIIISLKIPEMCSDSSLGQLEPPDTGTYMAHGCMPSLCNRTTRSTVEDSRSGLCLPQHSCWFCRCKPQPHTAAEHPGCTREALHHAQCSLWTQDILDYPYVGFFEKYPCYAWSSTKAKLHCSS